MKSATATTFAFDDVHLAAEELAQQIGEKLTLERHCFGILFCDPEMRHEAMLDALSSHFSFDIVGGTSIGILDGNGFHEFCAALTVFTSDQDCFSYGFSQPITLENVEEQVEKTYLQAVERLGEDPKLLLILPPYLSGIIFDVYPRVLDRVSGGIPVFGGVPSANPPEGIHTLYAGGEAAMDRLILIAIGGGVRPLFCRKNILTTLAEQKRTVTRVEGDTIYQVGDTSFVGYLKGLGLGADLVGVQDHILTFASNPLVVEDKEEEPFMRAIHMIHTDEEWASTVGEVPEGATLSVGMLRKEDIMGSAELCVDQLLEKIAENSRDGYRYGTILCTTCIGRFLTVAPDNNLEGEIIVKAVGDRFAISGFYSFGEFCPDTDGQKHNRSRFHTHSITLCAL